MSILDDATDKQVFDEYCRMETLVFEQREEYYRAVSEEAKIGGKILQLEAERSRLLAELNRRILKRKSKSMRVMVMPRTSDD